MTPDTLGGPGYDYDIYSVAPDGTGLTLLVSGTGIAEGASWSPDGGQIVYEYRSNSSDPSTAQIHICSSTGMNDRLIGPGQQPAISPDGRQIAYVNNGIYVMTTSGGNVHKISPGQPQYRDYSLYPTWSPDGSRIGFLGNGGAIAIGWADGSGAQGITDGIIGGRPAWSPDGTRLAFPVPGVPGIHYVEAEGIHRYGTLFDPGGTPTDPTWSPDGTELIFTIGRGGHLALSRINADGTGLTPVTSGPEEDVMASWGR